jgi:hypothetical protein
MLRSSDQGLRWALSAIVMATFFTMTLAASPAHAQVTNCSINPNGAQCRAINNPCFSIGICFNGVCQGSSPLPAGSSCSDGIFCNGAEVCSGTGAICASPGDPCAGPDGDFNCRETCNEATDSCTTPDPDGSVCHDGSECTNAGQCFAGQCLQTDKNSGTACTSDGAFCTGAEVCDGAGSCVSAGDPCAGPDGDFNCRETCNEATDSCTTPDPDGSACHDGNECTNTGECFDGSCLQLNRSSGTACTSDGAFCTGAEVCDGLGTCVSPGDPCTGPDGDGDCRESCNETTDSCTANDPNASLCDDGDPCTGSDSCQAGSCAGSDRPEGAGCSDGLFCNGGEVCVFGTCTSLGDPCAGPDGDDNCSESCDEATDSCSANDPDGSACAQDGLFCTGVEECVAGTCSAPSLPCAGPDGDANCNESCDELTQTCMEPDLDHALCEGGAYVGRRYLLKGSGTLVTESRNYPPGTRFEVSALFAQTVSSIGPNFWAAEYIAGSEQILVDGINVGSSQSIPFLRYQGSLETLAWCFTIGGSFAIVCVNAELDLSATPLVASQFLEVTPLYEDSRELSNTRIRLDDGDAYILSFQEWSLAEPGVNTIEFDVGLGGFLSSYTEDGFSLTPIYGLLDVGVASGGAPPPWMTVEGDPLGNGFTISKPDGSAFDLISMDAKELSDAAERLWTARGLLAGGGEVLLDFPLRRTAATDGGPMAQIDFYSFRDVVSVEVTALSGDTIGSFDNIVVPEPTSSIMLGVGSLVLMGLGRSKRSHGARTRATL